MALSSHAQSKKQGGSTTVGPGSPASINCIKLGGHLEIVNAPEGQYGLCHIEEWTLYKQMAAKNLVKTRPSHGNGSIGMANPASVNCIQSGGKLRIINSRNGQYGLCSIEEWALFRIINIAF
jgi:uncharacterized protein